MEKLSPIAPSVGTPARLALEIVPTPCLLDHGFEGRAVLPAVEAMQRLAASVRAHFPGLDVHRMGKAQFARFLHLPVDGASINAVNEIQALDEGGIRSRLLTRTRSGKAGISRTKTHVELTFPTFLKEPVPPPTEALLALEGVGMTMDATAVYQSLVPFGPSFQNLTGPLTVTPEGALTRVYAPEHGSPAGPLGSAFPLDAAFHAACVWGQRYGGMVGFPVGFRLRRLFRPARTGSTYIARVFPKGGDSGRLRFDIWLSDSDGGVCEATLGVEMQDVSAGRMRPPAWITEGTPEPRLEHLARHCKELCVMELEAIDPAAAKAALSEDEVQRFQELGKRRRRSFLGARMCCKRLSRRLSGDGTTVPAARISTIRSDGVRPRCPLTDGSDPCFCSVSHDDRFVVAVAASSRIGVDVEPLTEKALKSQDLYLCEAEKALVRGSPLGRAGAALRIWCVKEAVGKALGFSLPEAWRAVVVRNTEEKVSRVCVQGECREAVHEAIAGHLVTLFPGLSGSIRPPGGKLPPGSQHDFGECRPSG